MAPHRQDEAKFIATAKQGRQQLDQLLAQERADAAQRKARGGWTRDDDAA